MAYQSWIMSQYPSTRRSPVRFRRVHWTAAVPWATRSRGALGKVGQAVKICG